MKALNFTKNHIKISNYSNANFYQIHNFLLRFVITQFKYSFY